MIHIYLGFGLGSYTVGSVCSVYVNNYTIKSYCRKFASCGFNDVICCPYNSGDIFLKIPEKGGEWGVSVRFRNGGKSCPGAEISSERCSEFILSFFLLKWPQQACIGPSPSVAISEVDGVIQTGF